MHRPSDDRIPPLLYGLRGEEFQIEEDEERRPSRLCVIAFLVAVLFYAAVLGSGLRSDLPGPVVTAYPETAK